ncbi:MAG TPA: SpoIIE family protein phosphatase [Methanocorpusculum sp.]|nr:SpoIIE family protein phosphatase [Methanocorpusculum sp.]
MRRASEKIRNFFIWDTSDIENDTYAKNEISANRNVSYVLLICTLLNIFCIISNWFGWFHAYDARTMSYLIFVLPLFLLPFIYCYVKRGRGKSLKYILMIALTIAISMLYIVFPAGSIVMLLIPLVLSGSYYSRKIVFISSIVTLVMVATDAWIDTLQGNIDLNSVRFSGSEPVVLTITDSLSSAVTATFDASELVAMNIMPSVFPNIICISLLTVICLLNAVKGKRMTEEEAKIIQNDARIESELSLARDIQINMLPKKVSGDKKHEEFDIFATMEPAKEVGGDFYDYFMVDDTHVAVVMADVSGKGVPAAMFMARVRTLINTHAKLGLSPAEVFTRVNKELCNGNEAGLFVTAWIGLFDYRTGKLTYVNAGHNPPFIKRRGGSFSCLMCRPELVLAAMDTVRYRQAELEMSPGDRLYLYTDGVTEATNKDNEMYGRERLVTCLNAHISDSPADFLHSVRKEVDAFAGECGQFDDITMLVLDYVKKPESVMVEQVFTAADESFNQANAFIEGELEKSGVPVKVVMQILTAFEELFVNVAHYAYPGRSGDVKVGISVIDNQITCVLKDSGIPFDPLSREDPDITLSSEERDGGGLGIFMVKKLTDEVTYEYKDRMNIVTFVKKY